MKPMKTMISVLALSAIAGTAAAGDFGTLDADANGQVDFQEYKAHAVKDGKTETLAAQEFISMTQGDATLTETEFLIAEANAKQTLDLGGDLIAEPMDSETFETVEPAEIYVDVPQEAEAMESDASVEAEMESDTTSDLDGEIEMSEDDMSWEDAPVETPNESMTSTSEIELQNEVAGEVTTSDTWTEMESGVDVEADIEIEPELEDDIEIPEAPALPELTVVD